MKIWGVTSCEVLRTVPGPQPALIHMTIPFSLRSEVGRGRNKHYSNLPVHFLPTPMPQPKL